MFAKIIFSYCDQQNLIYISEQKSEGLQIKTQNKSSYTIDILNINTSAIKKSKKMSKKNLHIQKNKSYFYPEI
jgi:hypothetical protein